MPAQTSKRKNAPGQGRKPELNAPRALHAIVEQTQHDDLRLLAGGPKAMSAHVRAALEAYLSLPEHRALIEQRRGGH